MHGICVWLHCHHRLRLVGEGDEHVEAAPRLEDQDIGTRAEPEGEGAEEMVGELGVAGVDSRYRAQVVAVEGQPILGRRRSAVGETQAG